ncbi:glycoside hydrolase family 2 TIM barrel-domain containing protein [Sphingomonas sp. LaA6.9]|uniref:glycoside hydrolase family 2 TIM barrel-domain containing protein n=1 Tax=Sphingomonas sp. LaA6.9 TaxID=2919914 RepID=UPI001F4F2934|nr:glycoside hydrolase family 2 TIM barrel-domain containing protein [Sphingomonas sp. LaA6.9]MCJ8156433.1 malectin domain-containing carbohydrate-binding protein [Sphingomonas sp. LaA6.9]
MIARPLLVLLCGAALPLAFAVPPARAEQPQQAERAGRTSASLAQGWRFHLGDVPDAQAATFDDRGWDAVALPHNWNSLGEYRTERSSGTRNTQGVGWYRLTLDGAGLARGKRRFLQFDGVGNVADIWVNGVHVGRHAGAFSRFRLDVTDALRPGAANMIAIRADNSKPAPGSSTEHVIPLLGDFFIHGGIYRGVSLISVAPEHFDLLDHGGPGLYARTASITGDNAAIEVRARLRNARDKTRRLTLATQIRDAGGAVVAEDRRVVRLAGNAAQEFDQALRVANPRLWNGRADPYLYSVTAELRDGARVLDRVTQPLGIRSFRIDPEQGFFLNSKHLPLHGVSRHQDWLNKGWALTREDHERDMALIAEMGANTVRFAHYQHAPEWFELADRAGMIVWAELPFVNKVGFTDAPAAPELVANAREQLRELIRQNYNHPSVVTWGIGNEVDIDMAFGRLGPKADARPLLKELHALSKAEDPDRPTVIADCCEDTPADKPDYLPVLSGSADLMGYNRYFGWYYGQPRDFGPHMDALHAKHPSIPLSVSEYGAGGALSQHSDNPQGGPINTSGRPHPEEFQSWWHEQSWPQLAQRRYLWANWIWNMFDFSSNIRQEGDATDINDKGLVSFDRTVKKDAFYYYKAQWSTEPVVHITGRRYVDRAYPVTDLRIYSNAAQVRVALNGRDLGAVPCPERVCVMKDVALDTGANRLTATADFDGKAVADAVDWNAPDAAGGVEINVGDLAGFVTPDGRRTGSDNWFDGGTPRRLGKAQTEKVTGADARLLSGYREGRFGYSIPLPDGRWNVTLLMMEPQEKPTTARVFDVTANGRTVLRAFDPVKAAGGALRASAQSFDVVVKGGRLDLRFVPQRGDAVLSAITIRPAEVAR